MSDQRVSTTNERRDDWGTPPYLFKYISDRYGPFALDATASPHNAKCERYYTEADNGLIQPWYDPTFVNPPYGRDLQDWLYKALHEAIVHGVSTAALLPANTSNNWFHDIVLPFTDYEFIRGRVRFIDPTGAQRAANMGGSMIAHFRASRVRSFVYAQVRWRTFLLETWPEYVKRRYDV